MYFINNFVIPFIPFSKFVVSLLLSICFPILPRYVEKPVLITIAVASPLITLVLIKHIFEIENISFELLNLSVFSIGALSPVKTD